MKATNITPNRICSWYSCLFVLGSSVSRDVPGLQDLAKLSGTHQPSLTSLYALDCLLLFDPTTFALGEVIVVATQDRLNILLEIFSELTYLFLYILSGFGLRHSVFTYLSMNPCSTRIPFAR